MTEDKIPQSEFETPPLSPLAKGLMIFQGGCLLVTAPLYAVYGLSIGPFRAILLVMALLGMFAALWLFYRYLRKGRDAFILSEAICVVFLMVLFTNITSPIQYLAVAMARPLIDPWLAAADASLGVHVPSLTDWTAGHPWLNIGLQLCYGTLKIQFIAAAILLGLVYRDLARLWEYAFHFHFCLFVTVLALVFFPAECVFTYYGFESLLDQTRFIRQFEGFRSGALTAIRWDDLEGLISMPSFHVACGLMVTWSVRGIPWALLPVAVLNLGLITATVMCGAHYFVDLVATVALFGLSILIYEKWISDAWDPFNRSSEGNGSGAISSGQGENSVSSEPSAGRHS